LNSLKDIREAFVRILGEPPEHRQEALAALPAGVRAEVESLLGAHALSGDFLRSVDRADPKPGVRIGPYSLTEEIGRGGMGVVFRARRAEGEIPRDATIKFAGGRLYPPEAERRFVAEGRILALVDHPKVVRVLDAGVWQGRRHLVMEFVDGTPLTEYCRQNALPLGARLKLFQTLCESIQCAHQHLIIHRDPKPRNILVSAEGVLKVLDFGIARLLDSDWKQDDSTRTALKPLSLSCASPEQVRLERLATTTDMYSLGLLLYGLLTGHNPQSDGTPPRLPPGLCQKTRHHLPGWWPQFLRTWTPSLPRRWLRSRRCDISRRPTLLPTLNASTKAALSSPVLRHAGIYRAGFAAGISWPWAWRRRSSRRLGRQGHSARSSTVSGARWRTASKSRLACLPNG